MHPQWQCSKVQWLRCKGGNKKIKIKRKWANAHLKVKVNKIKKERRRKEKKFINREFFFFF